MHDFVFMQDSYIHVFQRTLHVHLYVCVLLSVHVRPLYMPIINPWGISHEVRTALASRITAMLAARGLCFITDAL